MVIWEITLGTAYFLGLKRTYKLALKIQRKIISPKHPKTRAWLHRRTRAVFDVAIKVHRKIQERDIETGRSFGNWILRCLDKLKPSAEIRVKHPSDTNNKGSSVGLPTDSSSKNLSGNIQKEKFDPRSPNQDSDRHLFTATTNIHLKSSHPVVMMKPVISTGSASHLRHFSSSETPYYGELGHGVIRNDIMQWMMHR